MEESNNLVFIDVEKTPTHVVVKKESPGTEPQQHVVKKHQINNKHKCSMCPYTTYNNFLFQEHINRHKGVKPYKCSLCDFSSVSKKYLKQHEEKHVVCTCGHVFKSNSSHKYKRHVGKCGRKVSGCKYCGKEYENGDQFERHRKTQELCIICSEFTCSGTRKKHMISHGIVKSKIKRSPFHCSRCDWSSSITQKVLLHLIHHPDQRVTQDWVDLTVLKRCGIIKT